MSFDRGSRFGHYEIAALIGVGGMGEVYRETDTTLKRDVALKVLPESLVRDASRLARLQREAELLAALNHPNVAQISGSSASTGIWHSSWSSSTGRCSPSALRTVRYRQAKR